MTDEILREKIVTAIRNTLLKSEGKITPIGMVPGPGVPFHMADAIMAIVQPVMRERDKAQRLLAEAKEALRPFSQKASAYDPAEDDDDDHAWSQLSTRGELRRARDVLSKIDGGA